MSSSNPRDLDQFLQRNRYGTQQPHEVNTLRISSSVRSNRNHDVRSNKSLHYCSASSQLNSSLKRHDFREFMTTPTSVNQSPHLTATFASNSGKDKSPILDGSSKSSVANEYMLFNKPSIKMSTDDLWRAKLSPSIADAAERYKRLLTAPEGGRYMMDRGGLFSSRVLPPAAKFVQRKKSEKSVDNQFVLLPYQRRAAAEDELSEQRYDKSMREALSKKIKLEKHLKNGYRTGILLGGTIEEPHDSPIYQDMLEQNMSLQVIRNNVRSKRKERLGSLTASNAGTILHSSHLEFPQDKLFRTKKRTDISNRMYDSHRVLDAWTSSTNLEQNPKRLEHIVRCQTRGREFNIISGAQTSVPYIQSE